MKAAATTSAPVATMLKGNNNNKTIKKGNKYSAVRHQPSSST